MKKVKIFLMVLVAVVLAAGTVFERYHGAEWVGDHFYSSWWFAVLMALVAIGAIVSIVQEQMWKRPAALLIHAAVPVILLGGAFTTWTGEHYSITLAPGETKEGITLERFEVVNYPGTHTPMDFVSHVSCEGERYDISMNHILRHNGHRYYQEDYDEEGRTTLSVSHDPWGIPITYTGYALLLIGLGWLMINGVKNTPLRSSRTLSLLFLLLLPIAANAAPRTLPKPTAEKMGEIYTLYKGRICPLQTFAKDFTTKLTGKATYEGLTPEQVFSGFLFYYSEWEPLLDEVSPKRKKESESLVNMLLSGHGLKLFPMADSTGTIGWYAQNDDLPMTASEEEYIFIRKHLSYCQELVVKGDYAALDQVFEKIKLFQEKRAADVLPSPVKVKAERLYNALTTGRWLAFLTLSLGLILFSISLFRASRSLPRRGILKTGWVISASYLFLLTLFLILLFVLRWIAGGHIPMAGGFDSMNLMSIVIGIIGIVLMRRHQMALPVALLTMGFCLLVAMMSGSNPPVTNLMPVLSSPLLCLHVAVIMMSYALFFFLMMIGVAGLTSGKRKVENEKLFNLGKLLLYPAVFLLALGIIIGALWANISWGNYWTWDPKEVWALITFIVYVFPLHPSLPVNHKPRVFYLYCTLAFLSVIITYFGVNFLLGGLHAYN